MAATRSAESRIRVGDWQLQPNALLIVRNGSETKLSPRAMDVLVYLTDRAGEAVTHEELLAAFWQGPISSPNSVHKTVAELRRALAGDGALIETIPKRGYRLANTVEPLEAAKNSDDSNGGNDRTNGESVSEMEPASNGIAIVPAKWQRSRTALALGLLSILLASAIALLRTDTVEGIVIKVGKRSAVLMPIGSSVASSDRHALEAIRDRVAAQFGATYEAETKSIGRVSWIVGADAGASAWNADYAVQLGLEPVDDRLRASLSIRPAKSQDLSHLEQFEAQTPDRLTLLNTLASHATEDLTVLLDDGKVAQMHAWGTTNVDAYRYAREGDSFQNIQTDESQMQAAERYRNSITQDPNFGYGYLSLASVYALLASNAPDVATKERHRKSLEAVFRAASQTHIDPASSEIVENAYRLTSLSNAFDAEKYWRKKLAANPDDRDALGGYADLLVGAKLIDEAQRYLERALSVPDVVGTAPYLRARYGAFAYARGDFPEAVRIGKLVLEALPDQKTTLFGIIPSLCKLQRYQEASMYLERLEQSDPIWGFNARAIFMAMHGDSPLGSPALKANLENPLGRNAARGEVCFMLGDVECGVRYWRQLETNALPFFWSLNSGQEQRWAPNIVPDRRYQALLEELGIGKTWRTYMRKQAQDLGLVTGIEVTTPPPPEDVPTTRS